MWNFEIIVCDNFGIYFVIDGFESFSVVGFSKVFDNVVCSRVF